MTEAKERILGGETLFGRPIHWQPPHDGAREQTDPLLTFAPWERPQLWEQTGVAPDGAIRLERSPRNPEWTGMEIPPELSDSFDAFIRHMKQHGSLRFRTVRTSSRQQVVFTERYIDGDWYPLSTRVVTATGTSDGFEWTNVYPVFAVSYAPYQERWTFRHGALDPEHELADGEQVADVRPVEPPRMRVWAGRVLASSKDDATAQARAAIRALGYDGQLSIQVNESAFGTTQAIREREWWSARGQGEAGA